jgi:hypothetical protein
MKLLLLCLLTPLILQSQIQPQNEIGASIGYSWSEIIKTEALIGRPAYTFENSFIYSFHFRTRIYEQWKIETGISYMNTKLVITPSPLIPRLPARVESYELITIPISIVYVINHYLNFSSGLFIDLQHTTNSFADQTGIGLNIGTNTEYPIDRINLFMNPYIHLHGFQTFTSDKGKERLLEAGVRFGMKYTID